MANICYFVARSIRIHAEICNVSKIVKKTHAKIAKMRCFTVISVKIRANIWKYEQKHDNYTANCPKCGVPLPFQSKFTSNQLQITVFKSNADKYEQKHDNYTANCPKCGVPLQFQSTFISNQHRITVFKSNADKFEHIGNIILS